VSEWHRAADLPLFTLPNGTQVWVSPIHAGLVPSKAGGLSCAVDLRIPDTLTDLFYDNVDRIQMLKYQKLVSLEDSVRHLEGPAAVKETLTHVIVKAHTECPR